MFFNVHIISDLPYEFSTGIEMFFDVHFSDSLMLFRREFKCFSMFNLLVILIMHFERDFFFPFNVHFICDFYEFSTDFFFFNVHFISDFPYEF